MPDVGRNAPNATHTQSVCFYKDAGWTKESSRKWVKDHDYYTDGLDETDNLFRWRQYDPQADKFRYRNQVIKDNSIFLVIGYPIERQANDMNKELRSAIAVHHTDTSDAAWDGPANETNLKLDASEAYYKSAYAWQDPEGDPKTKDAYRFIHHEINSDGDVGPANIRGCQSAIGVLNGARGGTTIPTGDRQGVWRHLAAHLKDADMEPAPLRSNQFLERELRYMPIQDFELREEPDKPVKLVGYASMFNQEAEIFGLFREKVAPGAYKRTIKDHDIRALWNHNTDLVLGRNKSGTLVLEEDSKGLKVEIIPPDTQAGRDAVTSIKRGDVSQMSIAFQTVKQEWQKQNEEDKLPLRVVREAKLFEVSPVAFPAFDQTTIAAERSGLIMPDGELDPLEEARRLFRCAEKGMILSNEQRQILNTAAELYQTYLLDSGADSAYHSGTGEDSEPDLDGHYSSLERMRKLEEWKKSIDLGDKK